ncbi:unnamed protein product, partial [Amoebophrya sp. A25]|eukprot:GSA25T00015051001.1
MASPPIPLNPTSGHDLARAVRARLLVTDDAATAEKKSLTTSDLLEASIVACDDLHVLQKLELLFALHVGEDGKMYGLEFSAFVGFVETYYCKGRALPDAAEKTAEGLWRTWVAGLLQKSKSCGQDQKAESHVGESGKMQPASVLAWGNNTTSHLGLVGYGHLRGPSASSAGASPRVILGLDKISIRKIAVGERHTLFLSTSGRVLVCGTAVAGSLGLEASGDADKVKAGVQVVQIPTPLPDLPSMQDIAAGVRHSVAVGCCGRVFSWGAGDYGQLGHGKAMISTRSTLETSQCPATPTDTTGAEHQEGYPGDADIYSFEYDTRLGGSFPYLPRPTVIASLWGRGTKACGCDCGNFTTFIRVKSESANASSAPGSSSTTTPVLFGILAFGNNTD